MSKGVYSRKVTFAMAGFALLVLSCLFYSTTANKIPAGFNFVTEGFGKTYYGSIRNLKFNQATAHCATIGAKVLKLNSFAERSFLELFGRLVWLDVANMTHWRDGSEMTYSNFGLVAKERGVGNNCVYADLGSPRSTWVLFQCNGVTDVVCEIDHSTTAPPLSTPLPTQAYVNLKHFISRHANVNATRDSVNQRFDKLERRLEQMTNVIINRLDAIDGSRQGGSNDTDVRTAIAQLQSNQNSVIDSLEDIKKMMSILYNSVHSNRN